MSVSGCTEPGSIQRCFEVGQFLRSGYRTVAQSSFTALRVVSGSYRVPALHAAHRHGGRNKTARNLLAVALRFDVNTVRSFGWTSSGLLIREDTKFRAGSMDGLNVTCQMASF